MPVTAHSCSIDTLTLELIKHLSDQISVLPVVFGWQLDFAVRMIVAGHGAVHAPQFCSQATIPAAATHHPQKHTNNGNLSLTISRTRGPKFSSPTRLVGAPLETCAFTSIINRS